MKKITKAVIPAAGLGPRGLPATKALALTCSMKTLPIAMTSRSVASSPP